MRSAARPHNRIPFLWFVLACAVAIGSWLATQGQPLIHSSHLAVPDGIQSIPLPHISEARAITAALNDYEVSPDEITLHHPRHRAAFAAHGVTFTPRGGGPEWGWQLSQVRLGDEVLEGVTLADVLPTMDTEGMVRYKRGPFIEQYVARENSLEQQFVLLERLSFTDGDLVIFGDIILDQLLSCLWTINLSHAH